MECLVCRKEKCQRKLCDTCTEVLMRKYPEMTIQDLEERFEGNRGDGK